MVLRERLRRAFWLLPAVAIVLGVLLAYGFRAVDAHVHISVGLFAFNDFGSARGLLSTIAGATVSVAGLSFSVTIVALQLASSQLSPRVLTTFREDRVAQATLAGFLGVFAYTIVLLARLTAGHGELPELSLLIAVVGALAAFAQFVAFIGRIVAGLQASTVIRRIAADGQQTLRAPYPARLGAAPEDLSSARAAAERRVRETPAVALRARRAGFVLDLDRDLVDCARRYDALVLQQVQIGDFVVGGEIVGRAHIGDADSEQAAERLERCFRYGEERTLAGDVAFPIRALADVALRALSASLNDPTTAENAIGSITHTLLLFTATERPAEVRVDSAGQPRLVARAPDLDDLVILGYEQIRMMVTDEHPLVAVRLVAWLEELDRVAAEHGRPSSQVRRQIDLLRPTADRAPVLARPATGEA